VNFACKRKKMPKGHAVALLMQTISIISPSWHVLLNAHMMSSTNDFFLVELKC
jgi:hypothetical protein